MRKHKKRLAAGQVVTDRRVRVKTPEKPVMDISGMAKTSRITKLDMKEEYNRMVTQVEPKKKTEPEGEAKYQCTTCNHKFNEKVKFCPSCGVEFATE